MKNLCVLILFFITSFNSNAQAKYLIEKQKQDFRAIFISSGYEYDSFTAGTCYKTFRYGQNNSKAILVTWHNEFMYDSELQYYEKARNAQSYIKTSYATVRFFDESDRLNVRDIFTNWLNADGYRNKKLLKYPYSDEIRAIGYTNEYGITIELDYDSETSGIKMNYDSNGSFRFYLSVSSDETYKVQSPKMLPFV